MSSKISQKQLGQRISNIRKKKGWSQFELADALSISRPSLAQLELGNRYIDAFELFSLAQILGFSMDGIMTQDYGIEKESFFKEDKFEYSTMSMERKAIPDFFFEKAKSVVMYLLQKTAGFPNFEESMIFDLLYLADFHHYEKSESHLSSFIYRKTFGGPLPDEGPPLLEKLIQEQSIQRIKFKSHGKTQQRFINLEMANLKYIQGDELEVINEIIHQYGNKSKSEIMDFISNDLPWKATELNSIMDFELAFYRQVLNQENLLKENGNHPLPNHQGI